MWDLHRVLQSTYGCVLESWCAQEVQVAVLSSTDEGWVNTECADTAAGD